MEAKLVGGMATGVADAVVGEIPARAKAVASVAASAALDVDANARFPSEVFAAAKAQRLLGIMVPRALGGEGASIGDVADVCYQLAQACSSTGMIYAMHQVKIACIVRHMGASASLHQLLRRLCAEQLLLASSTTEGQAGGNIRSSDAPIAHEGGRITLERKASVISYGAYADGVVTTARRAAEASASDQVLVALLKSDYTLTKTQGWNALGMRGTCSEGYMLKVNAAADQVLPEPYETIHARTMVPSAHLLWGSVWTGIAAGAVTRAQTFIRNAMRHSNGQLPPGAPQFTKAMSTLRTLRGMLTTSLRRYQQIMDDPQALAALDFQTMITLTKVEASELAASTVMSAMRACGLAGYRNDGDYTLGRHLRDVLSSPIMINNDRILANLATPALMSAIPPTLRE
jgi:acyl-CoA dehydrogenase